MLKHIAVVGIRNLWKNRFHNLVNIVGLAVGISCCLTIFLVINYEFSFDKFQPDRDRIYRIYTESKGIMGGSYSGIPTAAAEALNNHFAGVETIAAFHLFSADVNVRDLEGVLHDHGMNDRIIIASPEYFNVFNVYDWIIGSPLSMVEPYKVVLSESVAKSYFGSLEPSEVVGREVHYQDSLILTVAGIVKDIENQSDLFFTDFISFSTISASWLKKEIRLDSWSSVNTSSQLFLKTFTGADAHVISSQLQNVGSLYQKEYNKDWSYLLKLQPFSDLHFNAELGIFPGSRSVPELKTLRSVALISLLILVLAFLNFINLSTAGSAYRLKEMAVRKLSGATKSQVVMSLLVENIMLVLVALGLAIVMSKSAFIAFREFMPAGLDFRIFGLDAILFLTIALVVVLAFACVYPIIHLSSKNPFAALRTGNVKPRGKGHIRKALTFVQFMVAQVLIVGSLSIGSQVDYLLTSDPGFDLHSVIYFRTPWTERHLNDIFETELRKLSHVGELARGAPPAGAKPSVNMYFDDESGTREFKVNALPVDTSYLSFYKIKLVAGRLFQANDSITEYVINQTLLNQLGFSDPAQAIGKMLDKKMPIVGVVNDFHTTSLHTAIEPMLIYHKPSGIFSVRPKMSNEEKYEVGKTISSIETVWKGTFSDDVFDYKLLNETWDQYYETDLRTSRVSQVATIIALIISCLGLLGLSLFIVTQRTKEIGIRKVFGANTFKILMTISSEFLLIIALSSVAAWPVAHIIVTEWLKSFAYQINISPGIFISSLILSSGLALFTISAHTIKAAMAAPVGSLRHE